MTKPKILKSVIYLKANGKSHFWFTHTDAKPNDVVTFRSEKLKKNWIGEVKKVKGTQARVDGEFGKSADVVPGDGDLETVTVTITNPTLGGGESTDIDIILDDN